MASFEIAPSLRVWLELNNFTTVAHALNTGYMGQFTRSAGVGYTYETLLQFDMTPYAGYTVNSTGVKLISGSQGSQTISTSAAIKEQDKTAPGSWSSPPQFNDFAQTPWTTTLTNSVSMLNFGTYNFTGNSTFDTLVQSWIDTPSTNWGIICEINFGAITHWLDVLGTSRLVVDMDPPPNSYWRRLNRMHRSNQ